MTPAETFLRWLNVREGRGIVRKGQSWMAKDIKTGDVCSAQSAERLASILSADPELGKGAQPSLP
jgi:hypothetical protein